jgi:hypothetical protein
MGTLPVARKAGGGGWGRTISLPAARARGDRQTPEPFPGSWRVDAGPRAGFLSLAWGADTPRTRSAAIGCFQLSFQAVLGCPLARKPLWQPLSTLSQNAAR